MASGKNTAIFEDALTALNDPANRKPLEASAWFGLHSPGVVAHGLGCEPLIGIAALIESYSEFYKSFPDLEVVIEETIECIDGSVILRSGWRGTHLGTYAGIPPTGQPLEGIHNVGIYRFRDGCVVERWSYVDRLGVLEALGAWPARDDAEAGTDV